MRPRKLTDEQAAQVRAVVAARSAIPTHAKLAAQLGVSKRVIDEIARGNSYKVPHETVTPLHEALVALGIETP